MSILDNQVFTADYEKLKGVSLNPERHAAANAHEHSEQVHDRVVQLCESNDLPASETELLADLARLHDIGKITGTAKPSASVELLTKYDVSDERLIALAKYHDTNLPWYMASERGDPPTDKAWNRLARKTDMRLLCIFMVADRVDCPGGWRANAPLVWFLAEARKRGLLEEELVTDPGSSV
ncbi:MAG: HD domain-containing protein [Planctomycetota bacterium]